MSRSLRFRPLAILACLLLFSAAPAAAKDEKSKSMRVAIMPIVNASPDVGAAKIMDDILRDQLKGFPADRATFLYPADSERLLSGHDALDRQSVLLDIWSDYGRLDSTAASGLDSLLMADAVLFVKVAEWENVRVNTIGRG